jgi:hypothetical protein
MFALRRWNERDRKSLEPASRGSDCLRHWSYTGEYCKRHAKDTLHDRRFHIASLVLYLQWDTRGEAPRVFDLYLGIFSRWYPIGYRQELIDSAGADKPAVLSERSLSTMKPPELPGNHVE